MAVDALPSFSKVLRSSFLAAAAFSDRFAGAAARTTDARAAARWALTNSTNSTTSRGATPQLPRLVGNVTSLDNIIATPLDGCIWQDFRAAASIGGQTFNLIVDSGSTTVAVAGASCSDCGSPAAVYVPGNSAQAESATTTGLYGDGASWKGSVYRDAVSVGGRSVEMRFAVIDSQNQFLSVDTCGSSASAEGILGLARQAAAQPGTDAYTGSETFAVQLCDTHGMLWQGGYDTSVATGPAVYAPLVSDQLYQVSMLSVAVAGQTIDVGQPAIVDTGSTLFTLPQQQFDQLTGAITATPAFQKAFGPDFFTSGECVQTATSESDVAALPPLSIALGGAVLTLTAPGSYIASSGDFWCPGLGAGSSGDPIIIGAAVLREVVTIFEAQQVGFAPHNQCNTGGGSVQSGPGAGGGGSNTAVIVGTIVSIAGAAALAGLLCYCLRRERATPVLPYAGPQPFNAPLR